MAFTAKELGDLQHVLDSVFEGLRNVEEHPHYSAHDAASASGVSLSALPARYTITSATIMGLKSAVTEMQVMGEEDPPEANTQIADDLWEAIKHGDETHQSWLRNAILAYIEGDDIPPVVMGAPRLKVDASPDEIKEFINYHGAEPTMKLIDLLTESAVTAPSK